MLTITACIPLLPSNAADGLTLRFPAFVLDEDQAEKLPFSNPSAKIRSDTAGTGVTVGAAVGVLVGPGVLVGLKVAVGVAKGVSVGVLVGPRVLVGLKVAVGVVIGVAVGVLVGPRVLVGLKVGVGVEVLFGVGEDPIVDGVLNSQSEKPNIRPPLVGALVGRFKLQKLLAMKATK